MSGTPPLSPPLSPRLATGLPNGGDAGSRPNGIHPEGVGPNGANPLLTPKPNIGKSILNRLRGDGSEPRSPVVPPSITEMVSNTYSFGELCYNDPQKAGSTAWNYVTVIATRTWRVYGDPAERHTIQFLTTKDASGVSKEPNKTAVKVIKIILVAISIFATAYVTKKIASQWYGIGALACGLFVSLREETKEAFLDFGETIVEHSGKIGLEVSREHWSEIASISFVAVGILIHNIRAVALPCGAGLYIGMKARDILKEPKAPGDGAQSHGTQGGDAHPRAIPCKLNDGNGANGDVSNRVDPKMVAADGAATQDLAGSNGDDQHT